MKKLFILLGITLSLLSCIKIPNTTNATFLTIDQTDTNQLVNQINENTIVSMASLPDQFSGHEIYLEFITDKRHNPSYSLNLPPVNDPGDYNEFTRKHEIQSYQGTLQKEILNRIKSQAIGSVASLVFYSLAKVVNQSAKGEYDQVNIYFVSDLMNRSPEFNIYNPDDYALLTYDKDSVRRILDSYFSPNQIATTSHIHVHFLYAPTSSSIDRHFDRMATFLKGYLEARCITVSIGSTLPKG